MHFFITPQPQQLLQLAYTRHAIYPILPNSLLDCLYLLIGDNRRFYLLDMNLRQKVERNNTNNSININNSKFDFESVSKQQQIFQKSRRQCEQQLYKKKEELERQKANMLRIRQKQLSLTMDKFEKDFEDIRKQIVNVVNQSLLEIKAKYIAGIKEKRTLETKEELNIKKDMDDILTIIQTNLLGLKKEQYREYIAKIVTSDIEINAKKDDIKQNIRKLRFATPTLSIDQKSFSCFKNDLNKLIQIDLNMRKQAEKEQKAPEKNEGEASLHQNRDWLKNNYT